MADIDAVLAEALDDIKHGRARTVPDYLKLVPDADRDRLEELLAIFHTHQAAAEGPDAVEPQRYQEALELVQRVFSEERGKGELPTVLEELRRARKMGREEVVGALAQQFELVGPAEHDLQRAYHRLETGQLEGSRLSDRLLAALGSIFKIEPRDLRSAANRGFSAGPLAAQAFGRGLGEIDADQLSTGADDDPTDRGRVWQLFYGGPDG